MLFNKRRRLRSTFLARVLGVLECARPRVRQGVAVPAAAAAAAEPEAEADDVRARGGEQHSQSLAPPTGRLKEGTVCRRFTKRNAGDFPDVLEETRVLTTMGRHPGLVAAPLHE